MSKPLVRNISALPVLWRRYKVTVCIAAFAEESRRIVFSADSKVAFGDFSADQGATKFELLGQRYLALIAGNDIVYALPTITRIKKEIMRTRYRDPDEVASTVYEQLCETRNQVIEAKILKKYKLSVDDFIAKGKQSFTDQIYYDICSRIDRQELSLQFLVAGFDEKDKPHLRIVSADEPPHDYDTLGFAAVGTGAPAALASLTFAKDHNAFARHCNLEDAAYFVLAAKFMAESATDVGKDTYVIGFTPTEVSHLYDMGGIDTIRKMWLKNGAPRCSASTISTIKNLFYSDKEGFLNPAVMERCLPYIARGNRKAVRTLIDIAKQAQARKSLPTSSTDQTLTDRQSPCAEEYPEKDQHGHDD
jgi:hypothetical protein